MMEKNFDRILGEKLSRIKVEYDPESWSLLDQRLDAELAGTPDLNEQQLDEAVFEKLHRLRTPYQTDHWRLMSARLEQEFTLARQIIRYKALELGLVALLLLTMVQYLPMQTGRDWLWTPGMEQERPAGEDNSVETPVDAQPQQPVAMVTEPADAALLPEPEPGPAPDAIQPGPSALPPFREPLRLTRLTPGPAATPGRLSSQSAPSLGTRQTVHPPVEGEPSSRLSQSEDFMTAALHPLWPAPLEYADLAAAAALEYRPVKKNTYFRVGMFGAADYYRVFTPEDKELELESLARMAAGYGGGLTFGLERGRWEVESGLIYAAKQYQARPVIKINGSVKDGFLGWGIKDIEINIVNIPLNFRYNFLRSEKWRMYALAGASLQVAVQANYYTATQEAFRSASFAPAPATGRSNLGSFKTLSDELSGGWFEGGSFEENGYLTGNVGLGVERYFSGQWSVFVQPTYQHSINYFLRGLGPTRDEINTLSLYTGIRLRLKK